MQCTKGTLKTGHTTCRLSKLVKWLLRYSDLSFFKDGSCPPSWICGFHFGRTHKEYLEVFISPQNLVGIAAVALIVWKFEYFACFAWKCLFLPP